MRVTLHEWLILHGWKPEWFNDTGSVARIGQRIEGSVFVPFKARHRLFRRRRFYPVKDLLGARDLRIYVSSGLRTHRNFCGMIENEAADFPWDTPLSMHFSDDPLNHYFVVRDTGTKRTWTMWMPVLTWVREISIAQSEHGAAG